MYNFFLFPYGADMVEHLNPHVPAWKIGSGDLNYHRQLEMVAKTGKPVMIATGACTLQEVCDAVLKIQEDNDKIVLMQCNTNYTGDDANFDHINLNVLKTYERLFPDVILGLSDHTHGHETVLGAVTLGARVIEKHFTDDNSRKGPDHPFSMNPKTWLSMVESTRRLERSLGSSTKKVCKNETQTVILQRRSLFCEKDIGAGGVLKSEYFSAKRPCPENSVDINANLDGVVLRQENTKR